MYVSNFVSSAVQVGVLVFVFEPAFTSVNVVVYIATLVTRYLPNQRSVLRNHSMLILNTV